MTHAAPAQNVTRIQPDPHIEFAEKVRAILRNSDFNGRPELQAQEIAAAGALYAGKCTARALSEMSRREPKFTALDAPLLPSATRPIAVLDTPCEPERPCPSDDASTAASSTTATPPAPGAAPTASPQPQHAASDGPAAANADSAGPSADAKQQTPATSKPPAANAQAAPGAADTAARPSRKPTPRRLGTP